MTPTYPVKESENGRYFVDQNGSPVFWLGTTQWQIFREYTLDEARTIRMKPDLVLYGPDRAPCAVADAKYKAERPGGYPDADLYQMLAYCTALGLGEGHLVYAKGNAGHAAHRVRHAGTVLHQHALDLDQDPVGLLADVAEVAARLVDTPRV